MLAVSLCEFKNWNSLALCVWRPHSHSLLVSVNELHSEFRDYLSGYVLNPAWLSSETIIIAASLCLQSSAHEHVESNIVKWRIQNLGRFAKFKKKIKKIKNSSGHIWWLWLLVSLDQLLSPCRFLFPIPSVSMLSLFVPHMTRIIECGSLVLVILSLWSVSAALMQYLCNT